MSRAIKIIIGVDPGKSGGMACLVNGRVNSFVRMPYTPTPIVAWLRTWPNAVVVLEKVGGYIGGGGQPGSHMFEFGRNYGILEASIAAAGLQRYDVTPQAWQKVLGIVPRRKTKGSVKGESKTEWKNRLRKRAEDIFPSLKITLNTADALLIAEYGRRTYGLAK